MTSCERCETAPAVATWAARLRRVTGRGHVWSKPVALCTGCATTVSALLAPGGTLHREAVIAGEGTRP